MTRLVRHTNVQPGRGEARQLRPFSDFTDQASLVLLGDPGAGKTRLFKKVAAREHAVFLKARAFLSTPAARMANRVLFIDGLDEKRGGRGDRYTTMAKDTPILFKSCCARSPLPDTRTAD